MRTALLSLLLPFALVGLLAACGDDDGGSSADAMPPTDGSPGADAGPGADATPGPDANPGPDATGPWVAFLAPADGANPTNPVTFEVAAGGVATVQILADDWALGDPWDPTTTTSLTYTFSGVGFPRDITLNGLDAGGQIVATASITITVVSDDPGTSIGTMWNTYYYFANETDYGGADDTTLYDASCNAIATVPADFSDDVCIEGSGRLDDGRVINYATTCNCGRPCPYGSNPIICYAVLDPAEFPWGMGSVGNPLEPLRSWAVDNSVIPSGTLLYAAQWDGVPIPAVDGLGGFVHDGCFRADDVGGGIQGDHYDFFAGTAGMWQALEAIFPTHSTFDVYTNPGRCAWLAP